MSWWKRGQAKSGPGEPVSDPKAASAHLQQFVETRRGVEGYVEPPTHVTGTTIVLIAADGEWTRRAMPSRESAFEAARKLGIPVYDVNQTGYPNRMREWTAQQRRNRRA